jgi:hypothetical protein
MLELCKQFELYVHNEVYVPLTTAALANRVACILAHYWCITICRLQDGRAALQVDLHDKVC